MIYYIGSKLAVLVYGLTICGIVLGAIFGISIYTGNNNSSGILVIPFLFILTACVLSFAVLILSFFNKELFSKYFKKVFITFILTFSPCFIIAGFFIGVYYAIFHEEPYNESHTSSIISNIENNFNFKFPEKIELLRTGDTIAGGIDRPYVFIVQFVTDQNGLYEIKQSGDWEDITEEIEKGKWADSRFFTTHTPEWYKKPIEKGRTYEVLPESTLHIICVELNASESVIVYMDGWCNSRDLPKNIQRK
ncbi:MAG: hypothetical protein A2Y10_03040 [Planctomycetes bacterium GWF2_41_51]|nr:MAG: hypothetical protein A2Y10_03040 [Planctomycetes bacterium GWF2_41_51]HBG27958.1 hypothetical protein [Phycisphaerales bacterium]